MIKTPKMKEVEQGYGGTSIEILLGNMIKGLTQDDITEKIIFEAGVYITQGTISNWCKKFDIKEKN